MKTTKNIMFELSERSCRKMKGVDQGLINVVKRAIQLTHIDFGVTEGVRDIERQKHLYKIGASTTMNSKHLTGRAVDLVAYDAGVACWDWPIGSIGSIGAYISKLAGFKY